MKKPWDKNKNAKSGEDPNLMQDQDEFMFSRSRTISSRKKEELAPPPSPRDKFKTERTKFIESRKRRRKIVSITLGMIFFAGAMVILAADFVMNPNIVLTQQGTNTPDLQVYRDCMNEYFGKHPLERFSFLLKHEELQDYVIDAHPEVGELEVANNWYGGNSTFDINFRQPILVWKIDPAKYYVDQNGVSFTYNYFAEPTLEVTDQSGVSIEQEEIVASTSFIEFLGQIVTAINGYSYGQVVEVIVPSATREVDLKLDGRDYIIRASTDRDPLQEAEDMANALSYFDLNAITPLYVDVRVAHRAYYQ